MIPVVAEFYRRFFASSAPCNSTGFSGIKFFSYSGEFRQSKTSLILFLLLILRLKTKKVSNLFKNKFNIYLHNSNSFVINRKAKITKFLKYIQIRCLKSCSNRKKEIITPYK